MRSSLLASVVAALGLLACGQEQPIANCDFLTTAKKCRPGPYCGDGLVEFLEECDDGNRIDGDGCEANCTNTPVCGNAVQEENEDCDDGNDSGDDGCETDCTFREVALEVTCTSSTPVTTEEGWAVADDDDNPEILQTVTESLAIGDSCRLYVICNLPGPPVFAVDVTRGAAFVESEEQLRISMEPALFVTGAVRGVFPHLEGVRLSGGEVSFSREQDPDGPTDSTLASPGLIELPSTDGPSSPIYFYPADVSIPRDSTEPTGLTLTGIRLDVGGLAEPLDCRPVGESSFALGPSEP